MSTLDPGTHDVPAPHGPATTALRVSLYALAALSAATGLLVDLGGGATLPGMDAVPPTVDGELRFYAPFWLFYGAVAVWVARGLGTRAGWVPALAAVLFLAGLGRLMSHVLVGPPAAMFVPIMVFELVFPAVLLALRARMGGAPAPWAGTA